MAKEYEISRASGQCLLCQRFLEPGQEFMATVREVDEGFCREDYCLPCWESRQDGDAGERFGVWRARVPQPQEKRKLLVDDPLIINFFERLDGAEAPVKIAYRFVLALVLMRKKLLVYDGMKRTDDGREIWRMRFKGTQDTHEVVDPHMDEDRIAEVSGQLGDIMQGDL
jgi:hypothetical protein